MEKIKVEYKNDNEVYIIKIDKNKYYYGDGKDINYFIKNPNQILRFNPYFEYTKNANIKIPNKIIEKIKDWKNDTNENQS